VVQKLPSLCASGKKIGTPRLQTRTNACLRSQVLKFKEKQGNKEEHGKKA